MQKTILILSFYISCYSPSCLANSCGIQLANGTDSPYIVGGQDAKLGEYPWQVWILCGCGGTLIRDNWVLTAGHCTAGSESSLIDFEVYLGYNQIQFDYVNMSGVKALKVITHPEFNVIQHEERSVDVHNDIALIKIDIDQLADKFKPYVNTICLPDSKPDHDNLTADCWITGFGDGNERDNNTRFPLQKLSDWISDEKRCQSLNAYFNGTQQLCVGGRAQGGEGACHGDSGGPFQCRGTDGRFYQLGVTSYGTSFVDRPECGHPDDPDVYTKVSNYIDWIEETIKNNS